MCFSSIFPIQYAFQMKYGTDFKVAGNMFSPTAGWHVHVGMIIVNELPLNKWKTC